MGEHAVKTPNRIRHIEIYNCCSVTYTWLMQSKSKAKTFH